MRYFTRLSFLLIVALTPSSFGQDAASVQALIDKRREALPHIEVKFHVKETIEPGAWLSDTNRAKKDVKPNPDTRQEYEFNNRLLLSTQGCRYEDHKPIRQMGGQKLYPYDCIATWNNKLGKVLWPNGIDGNSPPTGSVFTGDRNYILEGGLHTPLSFNLWGAEPILNGTWFLRYVPTGKTEMIRGTKCNEYAYNVQWSASSYWISDDGYLVRYTHKNNNLITHIEEIDLEWNEKAKQKLPKGWTSERFANDGTKTSRFHATVTSWNFEPVDASEFDIIFPVGATVSEHTNHNKVYVVREDGRMQMVLSHNGKGTSHIFSQPATTENIEPPIPYWAYYVLPYWWVLFPLTLAFYLLVRVLRKLRRRFRNWKAKVQPA